MSHTLFFNTDSGSRDLGIQVSLDRHTNMAELLSTARKLALEHGNDYALLVLTSAYGPKPGAWYIKGFTGRQDYTKIKECLEANERSGLYSRRECILVKFK